MSSIIYNSNDPNKRGAITRSDPANTPPLISPNPETQTPNRKFIPNGFIPSIINRASPFQFRNQQYQQDATTPNYYDEESQNYYSSTSGDESEDDELNPLMSITSPISSDPRRFSRQSGLNYDQHGFGTRIGPDNQRGNDQGRDAIPYMTCDSGNPSLNAAASSLTNTSNNKSVATRDQHWDSNFAHSVDQNDYLLAQLQETLFLNRARQQAFQMTNEDGTVIPFIYHVPVIFLLMALCLVCYVAIHTSHVSHGLVQHYQAIIEYENGLANRNSKQWNHHGEVWNEPQKTSIPVKIAATNSDDIIHPDNDDGLDNTKQNRKMAQTQQQRRTSDVQSTAEFALVLEARLLDILAERGHRIEEIDLISPLEEDKNDSLLQHHHHASPSSKTQINTRKTTNRNSFSISKSILPAKSNANNNNNVHNLEMGTITNHHINGRSPPITITPSQTLPYIYSSSAQHTINHSFQSIGGDQTLIEPVSPPLATPLSKKSLDFTSSNDSLDQANNDQSKYGTQTPIVPNTHPDRYHNLCHDSLNQLTTLLFLIQHHLSQLTDGLPSSRAQSDQSSHLGSVTDIHNDYDGQQNHNDQSFNTTDASPATFSLPSQCTTNSHCTKLTPPLYHCFDFNTNQYLFPTTNLNTQTDIDRPIDENTTPKISSDQISALWRITCPISLNENNEEGVYNLYLLLNSFFCDNWFRTQCSKDFNLQLDQFIQRYGIANAPSPGIQKNSHNTNRPDHKHRHSTFLNPCSGLVPVTPHHIPTAPHPSLNSIPPSQQLNTDNHSDFERFRLDMDNFHFAIKSPGKARCVQQACQIVY